MSEMSIGQAAQRSGISPSAIRYYEQIGLLPEPDRLHGQRRYTADILWRLRLIQQAKQAGLSLDAIRDLFTSEVTPQRCWERVAQPRLAEINRQIQELEQARNCLLESLTCECQTLEECATLHR